MVVKNKSLIERIQKNLSNNMIYYTLLVMILGTLLGYLFNLKFLSHYILLIVFIMIYPMMVNLSISSLKRIRGSLKPLIEALILNFIYAPLAMWILTSIFISNPKIKLALLMLSIAPSSSMGLGYLGLAEGHILSGAIIVAFAFLASVFIYPFLGQYFASGANLNVHLGLILKNITLVLIVPLLLGILTREYVERKHGHSKFINVKPYFSSITLLSLYVLLFFIFASKANLIIKSYKNILLLLPIAILFYGITVVILIFLNRRIFSFEYGKHQAVVFTSVSKNVALTIAILISVFGKEGSYLSVFPAIMSLFQAPFLMLYLNFSNKKLKHLFRRC